jgi:GH24 family phage-related lysozyme (muramidase)
MLWTVGVGHVLYPEQHYLSLDGRRHLPLKLEHRRSFTQDEVNGLLRNDLYRFESGVARLCGANLPQHQFDALVSFAFNLGIGTLQRSTLKMKLTRGDIQGAADQFLRFSMAGGKILPGLQRRRVAERSLFLGLQVNAKKDY